MQEENEIQNSATVTIREQFRKTHFAFMVYTFTHKGCTHDGFSTRLCYTLGRSEHSVNVFLAKVSFHNANITVTKSLQGPQCVPDTDILHNMMSLAVVGRLTLEDMSRYSKY